MARDACGGIAIVIGRRVLIGAYCYLISANHCIGRRDIPIVEQGFMGAPIIIFDDNRRTHKTLFNDWNISSPYTVVCGNQIAISTDEHTTTYDDGNTTTCVPSHASSSMIIGAPIKPCSTIGISLRPI